MVWAMYLEDGPTPEMAYTMKVRCGECESLSAVRRDPARGWSWA
jgi:hypothetical protein